VKENNRSVEYIPGTRRLGGNGGRPRARRSALVLSEAASTERAARDKSVKMGASMVDSRGVVEVVEVLVDSRSSRRSVCWLVDPEMVFC
jgi:hypothetical protein